MRQAYATGRINQVAISSFAVPENPKRQGSFHFSLRIIQRTQTKGMRCFFYKFQSIANTELIINEFDKNILPTATAPKVPACSRKIDMFCSLSCRVNTFYRQNTETNSCYKCFLLTKTKNIIQRKLNSW